MTDSANISDHGLVFAVCRGDFSAMFVCIRVLKLGESIDQDFDCKFFLRLYRLGIVGEKIHTLWSEVCGESVSKMLALIKACELELAGVNESALRRALECPKTLDLVSIMKKVEERCSPGFTPGDGSAEKRIEKK